MNQPIQGGQTPPSDIPEKIELDVMNFLRSITTYAVKEDVYVIGNMAYVASELIRKYKINF